MYYIKKKTSNPNSMVIIQPHIYRHYWKCLKEFKLIRGTISGSDRYDHWFSGFKNGNAEETYFISTDNTEHINLLFDDL